VLSQATTLTQYNTDYQDSSLQADQSRLWNDSMATSSAL
jgi:hypothetical protein